MRNSGFESFRLNKRGIKGLDWLPNPPDLNQIEKIWDYKKSEKTKSAIDYKNKYYEITLATIQQGNTVV